MWSSGCDNNVSTVSGISLVNDMWSGLDSNKSDRTVAFALSRSLVYSFAVIALCATSLCTCHRFNEMCVASLIISFENTIDLKCAGSDELAGSWAANCAYSLCCISSQRFVCLPRRN